MSVVAVVTPVSCVVIDYRTGRTQLRPVQPQGRHVPDGAVVVGHVGASASWGTTDVPAVLLPLPTAPWRWRLGAVPALLLTAVWKAAGPRSGRFSRLVRLACSGRALSSAGEEQVRHAVRAVRWASAVIPARWACLEQSTAAAVLLAAVGLRAEWRHGVATDPVRLHAWIADRAGRPVEEPADMSLYVVTYTPDGPARAMKGTAA
ncbi:lasso peptide biosynthesis B2 protein [Streptomyces syringium]|uniref:lasso peptide biosynthesis B2 protein n=1 Tax=Streptomyces syringium TaxID=76729 RepID=UPI0037CD4621